MWNCQHCGADVEEDWETCWSCQWQKDGTPPIDPLPAPDLILEAMGDDTPATPAPICLRCGTALDFKAIGYLNMSVSLLVQRYAYEIFVCGRCGHVELFDEALRRSVKYEV